MSSTETEGLPLGQAGIAKGYGCELVCLDSPVDICISLWVQVARYLLLETCVSTMYVITKLGLQPTYFWIRRVFWKDVSGMEASHLPWQTEQYMWRSRQFQG